MARAALPRAGPEREALREKGQFWTPDWVAEAMVDYVVSGGSDHVFDPAVGAGAFFRAAKSVAARSGRTIRMLGSEAYPEALREAREQGLSEQDLGGVELTDFILKPPLGPFRGIVANPPYIRHHRLSSELKDYLKLLATRLMGHPLDGRAGLHVFFLLRALELLAPSGRLAFIMPADTCEGVYSTRLWRWIAGNFRLDAVVVFEPAASPFPGVDTNALVFMICRSEPQSCFAWASCRKPGASLVQWTRSAFSIHDENLSVVSRSVSEALETGLSRPPSDVQALGRPLGDFADVVRGIATGANEYFHLTSGRALELGIPSQFLVPAIGRTRDVSGDVFARDNLAALDASGRPTLLFAPDGRMLGSFPQAVREYLRQGEALGLPSRTLIATRRPWYKMETRSVPPYLFAYLGRRNARFVLNEAGVVPLTGFLCVYPRSDDPQFVARLWSVLRHPDTVANLALVGKSYGGGAIKVEPRALERLPLPLSLISEVGLEAPAADEQLAAL